ncbi:MAG TPA: (2Fe-2S)-binding protein [Polymorphobacter sp.]|nr:(2Fe-2S)-binding protein [Polymorphobacter sp.]
MIVCVCNALGEAQVREAARAGSKRPACAYARLGCKPVCGQCLPFARQVIREESARETARAG